MIFEMNMDVRPNCLSSDTLFIHGNLASNTWWEPAIAVWKRAPSAGSKPGSAFLGEWRGCGKSGPPETESELHPSVLADDYIRALRSKSVSRANIVAHSTGGLIALFALLKAPELFDRVVFLDPVGAQGVRLEPAMLEAFERMSQDREFCAVIMNSTIKGNDPTLPLFQRIVDDAFGIAKINWQGVPKALRNIDITAQLSQIQNPILILQGAEDPIITEASSRELAAGLPNAEFKLVKEHGHSLNVEDPALFVQLTDAFLTKENRH